MRTVERCTCRPSRGRVAASSCCCPWSGRAVALLGRPARTTPPGHRRGRSRTAAQFLRNLGAPRAAEQAAPACRSGERAQARRSGTRGPSRRWMAARPLRPTLDGPRPRWRAEGTRSSTGANPDSGRSTGRDHPTDESLDENSEAGGGSGPAARGRAPPRPTASATRSLNRPRAVSPSRRRHRATSAACPATRSPASRRGPWRAASTAQGRARLAAAEQAVRGEGAGGVVTSADARAARHRPE
ncbi:hypothetical protein QJS66_19020 [Kocuria rhizophila]|nr:hypothetical protein QJS66_19020 [Kocuria rhizophila]